MRTVYGYDAKSSPKSVAGLAGVIRTKPERGYLMKKHVNQLVIAGIAAAMMGSASVSAQFEDEQDDLLQEMQQLQMQIEELQQQVIDEDDALEEKRDDLQDTVFDAMDDVGIDAQAAMETLERADEKIQDESLSEAEREDVFDDAISAQETLAEGQQEVMDNTEVVEAQASFQDDLLDAMRSEESEIDTMIRRFEEIQSELR